MRELKFRVWNTKYNVMSYSCWEWKYDTDTIWQIFDCFDEKYIMQYTWLSDRVWREIYEWDIIKYDDERSKPWEIKYYYWSYFICKKGGSKFPMYDVSAHTILVPNYMDRYTVIWNIYENPELITA